MTAPQEDSDRQLMAVIRRLSDSGFDAAAVVSRDGVLLQSEIRASDEGKETFAAMAAALLGAAETATSELKQGVPRRIIVEIGDRKLIVAGAGPLALMVALAGTRTGQVDAVKAVEAAALEVRGLIRPAK